jgi:hypothetical protein
MTSSGALVVPGEGGKPDPTAVSGRPAYPRPMRGAAKRTRHLITGNPVVPRVCQDAPKQAESP